MSAIRTHAPQTFSPAKSTVLAGAGVQDAYWSDDEDEDAECPLCMEEMDVAEMGFKPCPCGYQICMFCYHHIKSNLNGRCPACRREYLEDNVQFTAVAKEDLKRQNQQKKRKERERKELEVLGRRHFANVRVVQRNVVYVVGLGPRLAKEELIPTLRSNEYFGQYGKISKMIIVKRNQPGSKTPALGLYITYHRREDATRAINAVDGSQSPGGGGDVMRASYGTTKYCMSFLRGLNCSSPGCLDLHEWGDKNDCFTKEDLATLKHSLKDSENHLKGAARKKGDEPEGSTRNTSWPHKSTLGSATSTGRSTRAAASRSRNLPLPRGSEGSSRFSHRTNDRRLSTQASTSNVASSKPVGKAPSQPSISRPTTPSILASTANGRPSSPVVQAVARTRVQEPTPVRSSTPTSTVTADSDVGSSNVDTDAQISSPYIQPSSAAPPGLPPPSSYQISTQAQALLDDVRARRDNVVQQVISSPFPEFDRTLDNLGGGDFHFQWSLDPKLAPSSSGLSSQPYRGPFDPFSSFSSRLNHEQEVQQFSAPPGLSSPLTQHPSGYQGPFNPFADSEDLSVQQVHTNQAEGIRQESRFGFARRKTSPSVPQSSPGLSSLMSPTMTGHSMQYQTPDNSWMFPRIQATSYNVPTYVASHDYQHRGMGTLQNNLPAPHFQDQQAGMYPPGLRFRPFDSLDNDRSLVDSYPAVPSPDPASQASMFTGASLLNELHTRPTFPTVPSAPPGLSPLGSTPSSVLSPIYSEQIQHQPIRPSLSSSHHGSSASASAHASPDPSPAPISTKPISQMDTILVAADFPALPVSSAAELQPKREQTQPYIQPPSKPSEPKIATQSSVAKKVKPVKEPRTVTTATSEIQSKLTETVKPLPPVTQQPTASTLPTRKVKRKQEKKEESKPPQEYERPPKPTASKIIQPVPPAEPVHEPLFSKVSKKAKPIQPKVLKSLKEAKDENGSIKAQQEARKEILLETSTSPNVQKPVVSEISYPEAPTVSTVIHEQTSLRDLIDQLYRKGFELSSHPFFDPRTVEGDPQTPLQYDPLVHALSALSVGGGSFANNLPAVSIDSAVSSFQQLLETLTQTISDLLRLLPRTTWDDSSSFDGVLRDMLKGDEFLDDTADDESGDDEVAALTLALERRARWMEVQLAKLEELHRDINTAAVRAVLACNDKGWDAAGFMPRTGKALPNFDNIGVTRRNKDKSMRKMSVEELQRSLEKAKLEEKITKQVLVESMDKFRDLLPIED